MDLGRVINENFGKYSSIENLLSHSDYDFEENPGTIEHILPENGNENYIGDLPLTSGRKNYLIMPLPYGGSLNMMGESLEN